MEKENDFTDWTEAYNHIRRVFCMRCEATCNPDRKAFCVEQFLYIVENWELSNDPTRHL
jgi:hypothetical protein